MTKRNGKTVLLAMSGGVDSSVAASLLQQRGYDVTGVFLCLGAAGDGSHGADRGCCSPADAADARRVAQRLGMELHVLNVQDEFSQIVEYFVSEYARGRTPNPCIRCNTLLKFGRLMTLADSLGLDFVATGHHARIGTYGGHPAIARAKDVAKDQSYALFGIPAERLGRILLPIGEIDEKAEVRAHARGLALAVHDKPDSQEICFVADDDYVSLLRRCRPDALGPGRIVNTAGEELGRHDGFGQFTIGQRRGLRVAAGVPMYVTHIDPASGDVTIGTREESCSRSFRATETNWQQAPGESSFSATVQIRYNHRGAPGTVRMSDEEGSGQTFSVEFDEPVHAIAPGQAAVVYDGDILLGGGWIDGNVP